MYLGKLKYLECCIKEALRLFPSVPMMTRELSADVTIGSVDDFATIGNSAQYLHVNTCAGGYTVPSGVQVGVCPFIVHRDERHWPDPEVFNPDRFLPQNSAGRHPYAYIPFSAGSRNCIGPVQESFFMLTRFQLFHDEFALQDNDLH